MDRFARPSIFKPKELTLLQEIGFIVRKQHAFPAIIILAAGLLSGCASHSPGLRGDRTALVSGKGTASMNQQEATQLLLGKAARLTVDHGFRYFVVTAPPSPEKQVSSNAGIRPGGDITIRLFRDGEIKYPARAVWDAFLVLEQNKPGSTTR